MRYGPDIFHGLFLVVAGLVWLVIIAAVVAILVLLVRFLLVGTKAAKLYIANNAPVTPSEAGHPAVDGTDDSVSNDSSSDDQAAHAQKRPGTVVGISFRTTLKGEGRTAAGIAVPEELMAELGPAKRYPVVVTINGDYTYRNSVSWYKGAFMISVSSDNQKAAGVKGGDEVDVTVEIDDAPRVLELPDDFASALNDAGVLEKFQTFSYSKQNSLLAPWAAAKSDATRDKNLAKAIDAAS